MSMVDYVNVNWWTMPFFLFGSNPIISFFFNDTATTEIYTLWHVNYNGKSTAVQDAIYQSVFLPWLPERVASLAFAITFVLLWYGILLVLYRRKIILKV